MKRPPAPRKILVARRLARLERARLERIVFDETVALLQARGENELGARATGGSLARKIADRLEQERLQ